jgi:hypothetical protein
MASLSIAAYKKLIVASLMTHDYDYLDHILYHGPQRRVISRSAGRLAPRSRVIVAFPVHPGGHVPGHGPILGTDGAAVGGRRNE